MQIRIVADNGSCFFVQSRKNKRDNWEQCKMSYDSFEKMILALDDHLWEEFHDSGLTVPAFFYHYGETEQMKRNGESYIFEL